MADPIEDLIREIASKHGLAINRDDPILVMQTINNRLLMDSARAQQAQLDAYRIELEALAQRWGMDAREKAERILNASLCASQEAMTKIPGLVAQSTTVSVKAEVELALAYVVSRIHDARRIGVLNLVASMITLAAALVALWAVSSG